MTARHILIAHASTAALRDSFFPVDEPLDEQGKRSAAALAGRLPGADRWLTSPELRTQQTAEALGLSADVEPMLRDCDYGSWSGKSFTAPGAGKVLRTFARASRRPSPPGCAPRRQTRMAVNRFSA